MYSKGFEEGLKFELETVGSGLCDRDQVAVNTSKGFLLDGELVLELSVLERITALLVFVQLSLLLTSSLAPVLPPMYRGDLSLV
jgi:hypothetical protein